MAQYVNNCYEKPSRLFITGGKEIPSAEGKTQGDPFAKPLIGPNASKSWLVVKEENYEQACEIFGNTQINIKTSGRKYLGSYIGTAIDKSDYANKAMNCWIEELKVLCRIARSEPHAAYTCFVSGFRHRITYLTRVIPDFCKALKLLDAFINEQFYRC